MAVHDVVAGERTLAIVMQFVGGRPLDQVIREAREPLTEAWVVQVLAQVLCAFNKEGRHVRKNRAV